VIGAQFHAGLPTKQFEHYELVGWDRTLIDDDIGYSDREVFTECIENNLKKRGRANRAIQQGLLKKRLVRDVCSNETNFHLSTRQPVTR